MKKYLEKKTQINQNFNTIYCKILENNYVIKNQLRNSCLGCHKIVKTFIYTQISTNKDTGVNFFLKIKIYRTI